MDSRRETLEHVSHDLAAERVDYRDATLRESDAPAEPFALFARWLDEAFAAKDRGELPEPTAMVLATTDDGRPSARTVLLKAADAAGFVFYTNYDSRKGREITADPQVALHFGWYPLQRQVRVEGMVEQVTTAESDAYFASRPRGSQLGAWASAQSSVVASVDELDQTYAEAEQRFDGGPVPRPERWGGLRVVAETIEFWQGQPSRMHDRLLYTRSEDGWGITRLAP